MAPGGWDTHSGGASVDSPVGQHPHQFPSADLPGQGPVGRAGQAQAVEQGIDVGFAVRFDTVSQPLTATCTCSCALRNGHRSMTLPEVLRNSRH